MTWLGVSLTVFVWGCRGGLGLQCHRDQGDLQDCSAAQPTLTFEPQRLQGDEDYGSFKFNF